MQSSLKYKKYYDRKAKAAPLKEKEYCFIIQPKDDSQASELPFGDYWWIGTFVIQKALSNDNYYVRRVNIKHPEYYTELNSKKLPETAKLNQSILSHQYCQPSFSFFAIINFCSS